MKCNLKSFLLSAGTLLLTMCFNTTYAQKWDDKIIISQCTDQYVMSLDHENPIVKNTKRYVYESNSAITVNPETAAFYGENITLDDVSGRGIKLYKNIKHKRT